MSTSSHDNGLLELLLAPLAKVAGEGVRGRSKALAVLRAGLVLVRVGTWLLAREGELKEPLYTSEVAAAEHDALAFVEMVITHDTGSPYPVVDG